MAEMRWRAWTARYVLAPFVLPGETATVEIADREKRGLLRGRVMEVLAAVAGARNAASAGISDGAAGAIISTRATSIKSAQKRAILRETTAAHGEDRTAG